MYCSLQLRDFREYKELTGEQQGHVQALLWDYYRLAWHEVCKDYVHIGDCPDQLEMMAQDIAELALRDEFEVCQLIKDTIDNSEQLSYQKLRRNRKDGRQNL